MRAKENEDGFELRKIFHPSKGTRLEIYRIPQKGEAVFFGGIHGSPFRLIEHKLIKSLVRFKIDWSSRETKKWNISENMANSHALLFRVLAPMKNIDRIRAVSEGIEEMREEEASYWMGMVLHRKKPARILAALRLILTTP